jgi:hypothetical protein
MKKIFIAVPALLFAGCAAAQGDGRASPLDAGAKSPVVRYRSAFEGYKPFADQELADWRKANAEVGAAGGHAGHKPDQGQGQATSKPGPGKPGGHLGHGAHK